MAVDPATSGSSLGSGEIAGRYDKVEKKSLPEWVRDEVNSKFKIIEETSKDE